MSLADVWFALFVLVIAGYLILDGFDIGVGIAHLLVSKTDEDRRLVLNSIGPIWDGNEVWLVLGGGVLFGAFPFVYASLFSGFYIAFILVLLVMILRTVAIEFRSQRPGRGWRRVWDSAFSFTSLALGLLLGMAFGNIVEGLDINAQGEIKTSFVDLLNPYALLVGVTAVAMFALHGLLFLALKTEGGLEQRTRRFARYALLLFLGLATATVIATAVVASDVTHRYTADIWPIIFPAAALVSFVACWRMMVKGDDFRAFAASAVTIALLLISGAVGMYPNLLISNTDQKYNLTVNNSASASNTLTVLLIVAVIGLPLVLLYTAGIYYFFRGKTYLEPDSY